MYSCLQLRDGMVTSCHLPVGMQEFSQAFVNLQAVLRVFAILGRAAVRVFQRINRKFKDH
jgi:hypothetical protein